MKPSTKRSSRHWTTTEVAIFATCASLVTHLVPRYESDIAWWIWTFVLFGFWAYLVRRFRSEREQRVGQPETHQS